MQILICTDAQGKFTIIDFILAIKQKTEKCPRMISSGHGGLEGIIVQHGQGLLQLWERVFRLVLQLPLDYGQAR